MQKQVSDWISFPLVGFIVGFFVYQKAIIWLVLFGLALASIRQSSLSQKHKIWAQGALWLSVIFLCIGALYWNSMNHEEIDWSKYREQRIEFSDTSSTNAIHELQYVAFEYPSNYELIEDSKNKVKILGPENVSEGSGEVSKRLYIITESQTNVQNFDSFAAQYAQTVHSNAEDFGLIESPQITGAGTDKQWYLTSVITMPHYEITTADYNGVPAIISQSNFGSMYGNVYEVTLWLGDGRLVNLYTDCSDEYPIRSDIEVINKILYSIEKK